MTVCAGRAIPRRDGAQKAGQPFRLPSRSRRLMKVLNAKESK